MARSDGLFEGSTFFLQYLERNKNTFFEDIQLIKQHGGYLTRFPLNSLPTHVVVDIPDHPQFHTYSLPAHLPPRSDSPPLWSLDQIMDYFTSIGASEHLVIVQRQWVADCVKQRKVLDVADEWGGWRVRQKRSSADSTPNEHDDRSPHRFTDRSASDEWARYFKRTRPQLGEPRSRSRSPDCPPFSNGSCLPHPIRQASAPAVTHEETSAVNSFDGTLAERMSCNRSPNSSSPLAERMSAQGVRPLKNRLSGFRPISQPGLTQVTDSTAADASRVSTITITSPAVSATPNSVSTSMPSLAGPETSAAVTRETSAPATLESIRPDETLPPTESSRLPSTIDSSITDNHGPTPRAGTVPDEKIEAAFAHIKDPRVRLRSIKAAREGEIELPTTPQGTVPEQKPNSPESHSEPTEMMATFVHRQGGSPHPAREITTSGTATAENPRCPDKGPVVDAESPELSGEPCSKPPCDTSPEVGEEQPQVASPPVELPLLLDFAEDGAQVSANSKDPVHEAVKDAPVEAEQWIEIVLQSNCSKKKPQAPSPVQVSAAPERPEGVFGLFSFGLTHPMTFFVAGGCEPGIPRMIRMAGGEQVSLARARFVIVPGNVGSIVPSSLESTLNGEGISPFARVVHEQWIKHCFRDECVLDPDDYLATPPSPDGRYTADSEHDTDGDEPRPAQVPPKSALASIEKIIKAVRDWRAGKIESNYTTVYRFVDKLSGSMGIKNSAGLYRQYRAYIASVAPDVARPPK